MTFDKWPSVGELLFGKETDKTLAFIDLWGTTSQIDKYLKSGDLLDIGSLTQIQSRFSSVLASMASNNPNFEVIQASDGAFIVADDPNELLDQIQMMFAYLSISTGRFQFIPLRAALSKGVHSIHKQSSSLSGVMNFQFLPYLGSGFVKVAKMEKSWPKGMRLLVTESVRSALTPGRFRLGSKAVGSVKVIAHGSEPYYEVNWLAQPSQNTTLVKVQVGVDFLARAKLWAEKGDKYQQHMGQSILDYGAWAVTDVYTAPTRNWKDRLKTAACSFLCLS